MNWHRGDNDASCQESEHTDEHHPTRANTRDDVTCGDGCEEARDCDGAKLSHCQEGGSISELLQHLNEIVNEYT